MPLHLFAFALWKSAHYLEMERQRLRQGCALESGISGAERGGSRSALAATGKTRAHVVAGTRPRKLLPQDLLWSATLGQSACAVISRVPNVDYLSVPRSPRG